VIGPAVLQGVFSIMAENESYPRVLKKNPQMIKHFADSVVNSCYLWRKDGNEIKKILNFLND